MEKEKQNTSSSVTPHWFSDLIYVANINQALFVPLGLLTTLLHFSDQCAMSGYFREIFTPVEHFEAIHVSFGFCLHWNVLLGQLLNLRNT